MSGARAPLPLSRPPAAVLFDCDGVLADSETLANVLVAAEMTALGWPMTAAAARDAFLGMALPDMVPVVEARVGPLPPDWPAQLRDRFTAHMGAHVLAIPGAVDAVAAIRAAGLPVAVASNSGRAELAVKLRRLELADHFAGRAFSFQDVARPKPEPDMYLAAARACGAAPADCVVIEDSATGARAGHAAGCRVLGFAHESDGLALIEAGAFATFTAMADLPRLLGLPAARDALSPAAAGD